MCQLYIHINITLHINDKTKFSSKGHMLHFLSNHNIISSLIKLTIKGLVYSALCHYFNQNLNIHLNGFVFYVHVIFILIGLDLDTL